MLVIRYYMKGNVIDTEVPFEDAHKHYKKIRRKHGYAEVLFIDNGVEHHVW